MRSLKSLGSLFRTLEKPLSRSRNSAKNLLANPFFKLFFGTGVTGMVAYSGYVSNKRQLTLAIEARYASEKALLYQHLADFEPTDIHSKTSLLRTTSPEKRLHSHAELEQCLAHLQALEKQLPTLKIRWHTNTSIEQLCVDIADDITRLRTALDINAALIEVSCGRLKEATPILKTTVSRLREDLPADFPTDQSTLEASHQLNANLCASVYTVMGIIERLQGHTENAEEAFRKALSFQPNDPMINLNLGFLLREKDYLYQDDNHEDRTIRLQYALQYFIRAYDISPNDPVVLNGMGHMSHMLGDYDDAYHFLKRAVAMQPDNFYAQCNLAWLMIDLKANSADTLKQTLLAHSMYPYKNEGVFLHAIALHNSGQTKAASALLNSKLEKIAQHSPGASQELRKILLKAKDILANTQENKSWYKSAEHITASEVIYMKEAKAYDTTPTETIYRPRE